MRKNIALHRYVTLYSTEVLTVIFIWGKVALCRYATLYNNEVLREVI